MRILSKQILSVLIEVDTVWWLTQILSVCEVAQCVGVVSGAIKKKNQLIIIIMLGQIRCGISTVFRNVPWTEEEQLT